MNDKPASIGGPVHPSPKSPEMEAFLENAYGRTTAIESARCIPAPMGCGKPLLETNYAQLPEAVMADGVTKVAFRDELSSREYSISGLCQDCQDSVFGTGEEDEEPEESFSGEFGDG